MHPTSNTRRIVPLLDPSLYALDEASLAFFKSSTDIHDDDQLKEHILNVQAQAYAVCTQLIPRGADLWIPKLLFRWPRTLAYVRSISQSRLVIILD